MSSQDTRDKKKSKGKKKAPDAAVVDAEEYSGSESSDESRGDDDDEGTGPEGPGDDNGGGGDEEEAKSDYSDVDEDLAYTFVGLDKKLWAKECPNPKGVQFVKEALKQALQVNEVEEGASRIVMDFMDSTDGDGEGGGGASRLSGILGPTQRNDNNAFGTASRPSMERIPSTSASAAAAGTLRGQERQPQQKMTEEEGAEEGRAAAEEFMMMKKRLEEKVMERIDADNEKNPVYKMLLKDEKVIDNRILVTVELIKYLRWFKKKLVN
jgi:hypothetical protein